MASDETVTASEIELRWEGPFRWPSRSPQAGINCLNEATVASNCGVYLWTIEHNGGYLIYTAGITCRPFAKRFREHTQAYLNGVYTIFDASSLKEGIRKEIWHGFWFKKRIIEKQHEYESRVDEIRMAATELLANYRVFVAPVAPLRRR